MYITLLARGKAVLEEYTASVIRCIREIMRQLPDEGLKASSDRLRRLHNILSNLHWRTSAGT